MKFWESWFDEIHGVSELCVCLDPCFFRLKVLRIGKLVRSVRMIRMTRVMVSLQTLIKCLLGSANTLMWSFSLLAESLNHF